MAISGIRGLRTKMITGGQEGKRWVKQRMYGLSLKAGRHINQDGFIFGSSNKKTVLAVADGMGGEACGEKASDLVLKHWERSVRSGQDVEFALELAHFKLKKEDADSGTTFVGGAIGPNLTFDWVSLGDSRIYVLRDGGQRFLLNDDQSLAGSRLAMGYPYLAKRPLTGFDLGFFEQLRVSEPGKDQIMGCVGIHKFFPTPSKGSFNLSSGDWVFLCTDGGYEALEHRGESALENLRRKFPDFMDASREVERTIREAISYTPKHDNPTFLMYQA